MGAFAAERLTQVLPENFAKPEFSCGFGARVAMGEWRRGDSVRGKTQRALCHAEEDSR